MIESMSRVVFVLVTSGWDDYSNLQWGGNKHPCLGWAVKMQWGGDDKNQWGGRKNVGGKKINKKMQLFPRNILY